MIRRLSPAVFALLLWAAVPSAADEPKDGGLSPAAQEAYNLIYQHQRYLTERKEEMRRTKGRFPVRCELPAKTHEGVELWVSQYEDQFGKPVHEDVWQQTLQEYERSSHPGKVIVAVYDSEELAMCLRSYAPASPGEPPRVLITRFLLNSHGSDGTTDLLAPGDLSDPSPFEGLDAVFAKGALIQIRSCKAGRGRPGEEFVKAVARRFLKKGGTVRAPTIEYCPAASVGGVLVGDNVWDNPFSCEWRSCVVKPGGELVVSDPEDAKVMKAARSLAQEIQEARASLNYYSAVIMDLTAGGEAQEFRESLDSTQELLDRSPLTEADLKAAEERLQKVRKAYTHLIARAKIRLHELDVEARRDHNRRIDERGPQPGDFRYKNPVASDQVIRY